MPGIHQTYRRWFSTTLHQRRLRESTAPHRGITLMDKAEGPEQLTDHLEKVQEKLPVFLWFGKLNV